jgi:hypothetical protein
VVLQLSVRKFFCANERCQRRIFADVSWHRPLQSPRSYAQRKRRGAL